jgi:ABC-type sugar transport system ATPase subunit
MVQPVGGDSLLLRFQGVTKRFAAITALDQVDFELRRGEIHALLGENGAGKSTLIKVLGGIHIPEAGTIEIEGRPARIRSVADADSRGIRIIHQELSLAGNLTVAENIYLGREPSRFGWLRRGKMDRDAGDLIAALGLEELRSAAAVVSELSVAHQQLVEIARALSAQAKIVVLDEPTSSLSDAETEALFVTLRRLRDQGVGIIYISHRLEEILRLADRITVLRDGRAIGTQDTAAVNQRELVRWMVGRDIVDHFHRPAARVGQLALEVRDLWGPKTFGASLSVRYGEVLGLAGLVGSGRTELARLLFGIDPIERGQIEVDGRPVRIAGPRDALQSGIVLVPEDRKREGLVMIQSVAFNVALPWVREWMTACMPNWRRRREIVHRAVRDFGIRTADPEQCVGNLSGGNQQKVLVARWMEHRPKVLILDEPTRGVDVGAREEMFSIIGSLVEAGVAVVLISSDLAEVLNMSHRVALIRDGRILRTAAAGEITLESAIAELTGAKHDENG